MPGARSMRVLGLIFAFWQAADGVLLNVEHDFTTDQGPEAALLDALADFVQGLALPKEHASRLTEEAVLALRHARSKERGLHAPPQARATARALEIPGQLGALGAAVVDASQSFLLEGGVESHKAEFLSNTLVAFLENAAGLFSARLKRNASLAEVDATVLPAEGFPERACADPKFFLSGQDYFGDVYKDLQTVKAGDEVIIAGWQNEFSITNLLGDEAGPESTMEQVLLGAAKRGAQIYIQFWQSHASDLAGTLGINFLQARNAYNLQFLHENIHVFLDTGRHIAMTNRWSWHIKSAVIDWQVALPSRRTIAHVTGMDFAMTRWDTADHLRPDPRRRLTESVDGEQPWLDAGVKVAGAAARDVRQALTSRHASYCNRDTNKMSRSYALTKVFLMQYNQCGDGSQPTVNPKFPDPASAVGTCSWGDCNEKYATTCQHIGGSNHCMCQDGTVPNNGKCVPAPPEQQDEGDRDASNTCRVLLTASDEKMDVETPAMHIGEQLIKRISEAEHSVLVDSQYFIGSRGGCYKTCPQNRVVEALAQKVETKIANGEKFSVVIFIPGMTSNSHMPTIKSLFAQEPYEGLYTKIKRLAAEKGLEWSDYVTVNTPMKIVSLDYLTKHYGDDYLSKVPDDKKAEVPTESEVSAYTPFDHSKFYIVDGKYAIVGSANLNDRSMMAPKGDAEMSVEVAGPAAAKLLEQALLRYTGKPGLGALGQGEGLAKAVHTIAMENNAELQRLFGMDFAAGTWARGVVRGDGLAETCCCKRVQEPACKNMKAKFSDGACCKLLAGTSCQYSMSFMERYTDKASNEEACIPPALFPGSDLKRSSDEFVAFIDGKVRRVQADPSSLRWQGVIIPETERLWFDVYDSYWNSALNSMWLMKEAVN